MKKILPLLIVSAFVFSACTVTTPEFVNSLRKTSSDSAAVDTSSTTYTLAEVSTHDSEADCWMVIDNKVYDVTDYVDDHPAGKSILKGCGQDASKIFWDIEKHGSDWTKADLEPLQVGTLGN